MKDTYTVKASQMLSKTLRLALTDQSKAPSHEACLREPRLLIQVSRNEIWHEENSVSKIPTEAVQSSTLDNDLRVSIMEFIYRIEKSQSKCQCSRFWYTTGIVCRVNTY